MPPDSALAFYPVQIADQRYAVSATAIKAVRRLPNVGAELTNLHTRWGRVPLCDLAVWAAVQSQAEQRVALLLTVGERWVGVVVDAIADAAVDVAAVLELPSLIHDASVDPTIAGVILIDAVPCLILDLETFVIVHMPLVHEDFRC